MQAKKILAGAIGLLFVGSTIAFAQTLDKYPSPFTASDGAQSLIVVGAKADAKDVIGAVDIATRLGSTVTEDVVVAGTAAGLSISGEGKQLATSTTKLFLNNSMGKTGLRNTLTKDDLSTVLKSGTLSDTTAGTKHNYQQLIYLTPSATANPNYELEFKKPGSSSSVDPTYNFGRFSTSPTDNDYLYKTYVTFDKDVNGTSAVGEAIELFGNSYAIHSDTTFIQGSYSTSNKLVLSGGAETTLMKGGETKTVTIGGKTYEVTLDGVTSTPKASITVKTGGTSDSKDVSALASQSINGLSIYVYSATQLSTTDQTVNKAKLMLGSQKLVLQHGSKVKIGDTEDSIDGTYVNLTVSSGKLSAFQVTFGGKSSSDDFLKAGSDYVSPVWKTFKISFPGISTGLTDSGRNMLSVTPSGDNILQAQFTDASGNTKTISWAYKASSTATQFSLADSSGNPIRVQENQSVAKDEYFIVDAGDFTHFYKFITDSVSSTPTTSDYIEIADQFSGTTRKITLGIDSADATVIDGQSYAFTANTTHLQATWGTSAANKTVGSYYTIWPVLKGKNGEHLALYTPTTTIPIIDNQTSMKLQLPTGAVQFVVDNRTINTYLLNITATTNEDGTTSTLSSSPVSFNLSSWGAASTGVPFTLGKTSTGGVTYNLTVVSNVNNLTLYANITIPQISAAQQFQPGLVLIEEKDDSSNVYSVVVGASTETSGSNSVAIPTAPTFTFSAASSGTGPSGVALGSDSTITDYVDLYGVYVRRTTTGQDTLKIYYPDEQVTGQLAVVGLDGTATISASAGGTTVKQSKAITSSLGRLDSEIGATEKANKHLILVGGPCANDLVKEIATKLTYKGKELTCANWDSYTQQGEKFGLIQLVSDAFGTGKYALVVAGSTADETLAATKILLKYSDYATKLTDKTAVLVTGTGDSVDVTNVPTA